LRPSRCVFKIKRSEKAKGAKIWIRVCW
jgi:hypothetical protein